MEDPTGLAFLRSLFAAAFGGALTELAETYWSAYVNGTPIEQIIFDIRNSPEHEAAFPGFKVAKGKDPRFTEGQWIGLTREYVANFRQFGVRPTFFDDPSDFRGLIEGEINPREHLSRLTLWDRWTRQNTDPVVREEMQRQAAALGYTLNDGDFLMLAMDFDRALTALERAEQAGLLGAEARRADFGQLAVSEALSLTDLGVTQEQARAGFGALAEGRELLAPLPGEAGDTFSRQEQLGLVSGTDAAARRRLERQARRRTAAFQGSGGYSAGSGALTGLAPA